MDCLNNHELNFVDQDAMTCLCQGRILEIDKRYNGTKWTGCTDECFIKHYAGIANWYRFPEAIEWYHKDWDEVLEMHEKAIKEHAGKLGPIPERL